ncbi:small integral membrane protein 19 isoform X2 [Phyllopteryx taeniolatus]|uniref:small integral membrane protein 19 isoform X2 n=1 Tax=Phycodurus eques TaxID=693459 RepID=UPI002ACE026D|nr:small integral membrane protein 19 isoform X2 [Phycodurus eques]XP_061642748.1 small integral membrane protein 19 isoform X2 [Phyllopteryx taeniolatus]
MGAHGHLGNEPESIDYSVHEAWNEATNVYLLVILVSFGLLINKRKIMRIFTLPPTAESSPEPNFYDSLQKVRLRQQLEMYSLARKYDQQQHQGQADSVQLSME